ncbi:MAG: diguanylate cyclase [Rhodoferax sp.]|nr:diguanylate cyclase [Rhodoferax sp.]
MPLWLSRVCATLLLVGVGVGAVHATETITLTDNTPRFQITGPILSWIELQNASKIEAVAAKTTEFEAQDPQYRHTLQDGDSLWIKLRLQIPAGNSSRWTLSVPLPTLDCIKLYQSDGKGGWVQQIAGDTRAQAEWTKKALHADFDLTIPPGAPQDVYIRVRNFKHVNIPILLASTAERDVARLREYVYLGAILGMTLALALLSLIRYLEHRNKSDAWASAYGLLIALTIAQINGIANALWWGSSPEFGDMASSCVRMLAMGSTLLFVRHLYGLSVRFRRYDKFLEIVGWATLGSVLGFIVLDRPLADLIGSALIFLSTTCCLVATFLNWRGGSSVARWLMLAFVPQFVMLMWMMAEAVGLAPTVWELRYLMSAMVALTVPLLVHALSVVTHDRKELRARHHALPTQDALTGILTPEAFEKAMQEARTRVIEEQDPIALLLVDVINHEHIRETMGDQTAEQCLLRAVVKLHRVLRDVDQAGRVGSARFALLLEGVRTRQEVTERMVKLIASGLIPLKGLHPEVTLQFHISAVLLQERPLSPAEAMTKLDEVLGSMSPRTRRPIRFLEPEATMAAPLDVMA